MSKSSTTALIEKSGPRCSPKNSIAIILRSVATAIILPSVVSNQMDRKKPVSLNFANFANRAKTAQSTEISMSDYPVQVLPSCKKRLRWCQGQFIAVGQLNTIGKVIMKTSVTLTFDSVEDMVAHFAATASPNVTVTNTFQTAPTQPVATAMPQAPGAAPTSSDVDKNGLPWDERIHSPSKAVNQDGSWRGKKGVTAEEKAAVTAELTAQPQIQTNPEDRQDPAAVTPPMPTMQPAPTPPQAATPMPVMQPQATPPIPTMQPAPIPPQAAAPMPVVDQAPAANPQQSFQNFMQTLAPQMQSGVVDTNHLAVLTNEIATAFNVQLSAITDIANNQQMIDYAIGCLTRDGKWV